MKQEERFMKPIDWNKPVVTRDGRKVRVLCTDAGVHRPVIALVDTADDLLRFNINGRFREDSVEGGLDLINAL